MLVGDDLYINQISPTRQARTASHVFVHPQYSIDGLLNDVAVIRVSRLSTNPRIEILQFDYNRF